MALEVDGGGQWCEAAWLGVMSTTENEGYEQCLEDMS